MDKLKKARSSKARTLTRLINELKNARSLGSSRIEVEEKISNVKYTFEQLGEAQDDVLEAIEDGDVNADQEWYQAYDRKMNIEVIAAREYLEELEINNAKKLPVKIEKLKIPKFDADPKNIYDGGTHLSVIRKIYRKK